MTIGYIEVKVNIYMGSVRGGYFRETKITKVKVSHTHTILEQEYWVNVLVLQYYVCAVCVCYFLCLMSPLLGSMEMVQSPTYRGWYLAENLIFLVLWKG